MGTLTDSLFSILMSWVRALVSGIWALFNSDRTTLLAFLGQNWLMIALAIIAAGLVIDWLIWLIRWQPYHIWAKRARRLLRIEDPEDEEAPAHTAYMPPQEAQEAEEEDEAQWMPLEPPAIGEAEAAQVMDAAEQAPDEYAYPGMRYDEANRAAEEPMSGTRRYAAVHEEGPGAAEVTRRRAEIDAWQQQLREEARQKAEAERAARLAQAEEERRTAQEAARLAYEAEQQRLAQAEEERRAAQEAARRAHEAEQQRLAQAQYERELAEYERQKAQYERDMAAYEQQKAEYEAALAQQEAAQRAAAQQSEAAEEIVPAAQGGARRRRRSAVSYSDYVEGEAVETLPAAPAWTDMQPIEEKKPEPKAAKKGILHSGMQKMAKMIEVDESEVKGIASLPPRVDRSKAYKPAKKPDGQ